MGKITEEMPMNITVYLGANEGSDPALKQAVEELGRWIGESGNARFGHRVSCPGC